MTDADKKTCETCWFWKRIPHMLDFELGRCELFEREMRTEMWCELWEGQLSEVMAFEQKGQKKPY